MEIERAKKILSTLADGINPVTGEILPDSDSSNQAEVVRAIYTVLKAVDVKSRPKSTPENAGKPWDSEDDQMLCQMFDSGVAKKEICRYFKRTEGGIDSRLVKLGKIETDSELK